MLAPDRELQCLVQVCIQVGPLLSSPPPASQDHWAVVSKLGDCKLQWRAG